MERILKIFFLFSSEFKITAANAAAVIDDDDDDDDDIDSIEFFQLSKECIYRNPQ